MSRSLMGTGKLFTIDEDTIHINSGKGNFSLRSIGEKDQSYNCPLSFTVYRFLLHLLPFLLPFILTPNGDAEHLRQHRPFFFSVGNGQKKKKISFGIFRVSFGYLWRYGFLDFALPGSFTRWWHGQMKHSVKLGKTR